MCGLSPLSATSVTTTKKNTTTGLGNPTRDPVSAKSGRSTVSSWLMNSTGIARLGLKNSTSANARTTPFVASSWKIRVTRSDSAANVEGAGGVDAVEEQAGPVDPLASMICG